MYSVLIYYVYILHFMHEFICCVPRCIILIKTINFCSVQNSKMLLVFWWFLAYSAVEGRADNQRQDQEYPERSINVRASLIRS